jgi:O-antigen ligase
VTRRWRLAGAVLVPAFPILGLPAALATLALARRQALLPAAAALGACAVLLVVSGLLGPGAPGSLGVSATALAGIVLTLAYGATLARSVDRAVILDALLAGGLVSGLVALARAPFFEWTVGYPRLQGILGQENLLGMQMAVSLALLLGGAGRRWPLPARLAAGALLTVALALAGPRAGLAAVLAALVVAAGDWLLQARRGALLAVLGAAVIALTVGATLGLFGERLNPVHAAGQGRLAVWERSVAVIAEHPLLGVGLNGLSAYLQRERGGGVPPHAHNFILGWLAEAGLIGGVPLIGLLLWAGVIAWRRWPGTRPFLAAFLVTNLVDYNLGSAYVAPMLFIVLGAALVAPRQR